MDALRKMTIYSAIWTLIMFRTGVESVHINSPRAVFHLVREKYYQKHVGRTGSTGMISQNGLTDTEQDTDIIEVQNKLPEYNDVSQVIRNSRRQADEGDNKVAFYAVLTTDVAGLGAGQTIPFDQAILNEGNAFDKDLHAFVCPVKGVYLFRSALMCEANSHIETEVVKDNSPLFRMYSSGFKTSYHYDQGFNAGITDCEKHQNVWVRVNGNLGTSVRHLFTTFSGYLLNETGVSQPNVAFHSYLGKNINDLAIKQTIPFDKLLLNEGDGYENNSRHEFTCPVDGIYMFQSSVFSNYGAIETEIVKDGNQFVRIYAAASGESNVQHDQGFNAGIIHCSKGQNVWVQVVQGASIMQYQYTTFSGYLMWATAEASATPNTERAHDMDPTQVAFHSYLSTGVDSIGEKLTVPFDRVSLNEGKRFDAWNHVFTCPVDGTYLFQSAIMVKASQIETDIVKNESSFSNMFAGVNNQIGNSHFDQGYNSAIVNCSIYDRIWVWVGSLSGTSIDYHNTTTFSGFLLWETQDITKP